MGSKSKYESLDVQVVSKTTGKTEIVVLTQTHASLEDFQVARENDRCTVNNLQTPALHQTIQSNSRTMKSLCKIIFPILLEQSAKSANKNVSKKKTRSQSHTLLSLPSPTTELCYKQRSTNKNYSEYRRGAQARRPQGRMERTPER